MELRPDPRWSNFIGGLTSDGQPMPMSFELLGGIAREWEELVPGLETKSGPGSLLRMARSLFAYAWFDYEFMVVACLIGFQALEASLRWLYPEAERVPFRALVRKAREEGILPSNIAEVADAGVELRNLYSHPATQGAMTVGMAAPMLRTTHMLVAVIMAAAANGDG